MLVLGLTNKFEEADRFLSLEPVNDEGCLCL